MISYGWTGSAKAQTNVDCTAGANVLSTTVHGLAGAGPHEVVITDGPCQQTETIVIENRNQFTIRAQSGTVAVQRTLPGSDPNPNALVVRDSHSVRLEGLDISGGQNGVLIQSSRLEMDSCNLHNNLRGLRIMEESTVSLAASTIQNNSTAGIGVENSTLNAVGITVQNNGGIAINLNSSRGVFGDFETPSYVRNHPSQGIRATAGSSLVIQGPMEISNNGGVGVNISLGSYGIISGGGTNTTLLPTIVEGHTVGIQVLGQAQLSSPLIVRNNGGTAPFSSGIHVANGGALYTAAGGGADVIEVTTNTGDGLHAASNAAVQLNGGLVISNNTRDGIRAVRSSVLNFAQPAGLPSSITGNGGRTIQCDSSSMVYGDLTGVDSIKCTIAKDP